MFLDKQTKLSCELIYHLSNDKHLKLFYDEINKMHSMHNGKLLINEQGEIIPVFNKSFEERKQILEHNIKVRTKSMTDYFIKLGLKI